jgi:hypothetical protein
VVGALAAIESVLGAAERFPAEFAAAGMLARDLDALRALRAELVNADIAQEAAKGRSTASTAARNALLRDLTARVDRLIAAAEVEFALEPDKRAAYHGPLPTRGRRRAPAEEAAAEG